MVKRILTLTLCACFAFGPHINAGAVDQGEGLKVAAQYLEEQGVMVGDQNGDMELDRVLTRAELAVILTRLTGTQEQLQAEQAFYAGQCVFPDVPEWARPYVGYCYANRLMGGYDTGLFGTQDKVTLSAACTVILRYFAPPEVEWSYFTACRTARELGLIDEISSDAAEVTRGELAVMLYRAMATTGAGAEDHTAGLQPGSAGSNANFPGGVEQKTGDGYLTNGKPVTEENVLELLRQLEQDWPDGTVWGTHNTPGTHKNEVPGTAAREIMDVYLVSEYYGCSGYAAMISSLIFGDAANPGRRVEDLSQIRPGDIIFWVRNDNGKVWHVLVALETPNEINAFHATDGNAGETVRWPDRQNPYGRNNLDSYGYGENKTYHLEAWTRYPEDVSFTGESKNVWPTGDNEP